MKKPSLVLILCLAFVLRANAGVKHALVFGIGHYEDKAWSTIHGDADIDYVKKMLTQNGYADIKTLKNEQATKHGMVLAFKDLTAKCKEGDEVYIHYSGHGQLMTDLNGDEALRTTARHGQWDESWVPYDAYMTYCEKDRGEKHFSDDEVALFLSNIRKKIGDRGRLMVVIDACHSGDATMGDNEECVRGIDTKFNIPKTGNERIAEAPVEEWWLTVSACKPYQLCAEMKNPQVGKLTYAMCTLGTKAFRLSPKEIQLELNRFMELHKGQLPQNPVVSGLLF